MQRYKSQEYEIQFSDDFAAAELYFTFIESSDLKLLIKTN